MSAPLPGIRVMRDVSGDTVSAPRYIKMVLPTCVGAPGNLNLTGEVGSMILDLEGPSVWVMTGEGWFLIAWDVPAQRPAAQ
jgi:hypothetical protein